jgi:hypothetical protein
MSADDVAECEDLAIGFFKNFRKESRAKEAHWRIYS